MIYRLGRTGGWGSVLSTYLGRGPVFQVGCQLSSVVTLRPCMLLSAKPIALSGSLINARWLQSQFWWIHASVCPLDLCGKGRHCLFLPKKRNFLRHRVRTKSSGRNQKGNEIEWQFKTTAGGCFKCPSEELGLNVQLDSTKLCSTSKETLCRSLENTALYSSWPSETISSTKWSLHLIVSKAEVQKTRRVSALRLEFRYVGSILLS